jgi:hypothetical protein
MYHFDLTADSFNVAFYQVELRKNFDCRRFDDTLHILLDYTPEEVHCARGACSPASVCRN